MKQTHEGAPAGVGAIYSWAGNSDVGEGRMTIIESKPNELVRNQARVPEAVCSDEYDRLHLQA